MNAVFARRLAVAASATLALTLLNACAVTGVDGSVGVGYDAGYYEPWGYDYGGWGYDYRVGPGRGGDRHGGSGDRGRDGDRHGGPRSYRPAPAERRMPSLPSRSRGPHH